ncbi:CvpA family protein [Lacibacter luteus]|nr:CvpA family protein [Lacibacter luteus]
MNYVDVYTIVLLIVAAYIGFRTGAAKLFSEIIKWIASAAIAVLLPLYINSNSISGQPLLKDFYLPLCMFTLFLLTYLLLSFIQQLLTKNAGNSKHLTNRIAGIFPGLLLGVLVVTVSSRIATLTADSSVADEVKSSFTYNATAPYISLTENYISPRIANVTAGAETTNSNAEVYATALFKHRPDLEYQMLQLLNKERKQRGLSALQADEPLRKVARQHSEDMLRRGYFSHVSPEGKDPFYRMKKAGIQYKLAGENLAYASTLSKAHTGLMHSKLHREAILNPKFKRVGIGIADGGKNGLMISQEFRD